METATLLSQGITLLTYGMGTVFVFLTLLVIATTFMSKVVSKLVPDEPEPAPVAAAPSSSGAVNAHTLAVIKAAIKQHRGQ